MAEVRKMSAGFVAWRLLRSIVMVGGLFLAVAFTILLLVWGLAWLTNTGGTWAVGAWNVLAVILILVMITGTLLIVAERKWAARLQNRVGPNRARFTKNQKGSFYAIPHLIADAVKMLTKEDFVPPQGAKFLFNLAPVMAVGPAIALMAVIPVGPDIEAFGTAVRFQVGRLDMGLLYVFAISSLAVYGTTLAGWSANNKFGLLGGLRASAQMVSYEVTLGLTLVGAFMLYQSLRPYEIVQWQDATAWAVVPRWGVFYQPFAFVFFLAAAFAEVKRAPFDMPEGESEIVGYFVEYSGMKFGIFMLSEFLEIVVLAGLITALFFGGWSIPWVPTSLLQGWMTDLFGANWGALATALVALFVFVTKLMFFVWLQMMIRWTFPRFRYDQVMDLGWKILLPLSLANVIVTAVVIVLDPTLTLALIVGLVEFAVLAGVVASASAPDRADTIAGSHGGHEDLHGHAVGAKVA